MGNAPPKCRQPFKSKDLFLSGDNKMTTQGLLGFRYNDKDRLAYNHSDSQPDILGLKMLKELRDVEDWDKVRERMDGLVTVPETRRLNENSALAETEIRRYFPNLEYSNDPKNYYDLYQPLQGTLKPYLDGKLMFMPDATDFIYNSLHCEWAYIANLDTEKFEVWKGNQLEADSEDNRMSEEENRYGRDGGEYHQQQSDFRLGTGCRHRQTRN
jgi:hypothetical protein